MKHLSIFTLFALLTIWAGLVFGSGSHHHNTVINNYVTEVTEVTNNHSTVNADDADRASMLAISQCHFDMSTRANQGCAGVGYDANTSNNAFALGFGRRLDNKNILFNGSVALDNDEKPAYGVGVNFHF